MTVRVGSWPSSISLSSAPKMPMSVFLQSAVPRCDGLGQQAFVGRSERAQTHSPDPAVLVQASVEGRVCPPVLRHGGHGDRVLVCHQNDRLETLVLALPGQQQPVLLHLLHLQRRVDARERLFEVVVQVAERLESGVFGAGHVVEGFGALEEWSVSGGEETRYRGNNARRGLLPGGAPSQASCTGHPALAASRGRRSAGRPVRGKKRLCRQRPHGGSDGREGVREGGRQGRRARRLQEAARRARRCGARGGSSCGSRTMRTTGRSPRAGATLPCPLYAAWVSSRPLDCLWATHSLVLCCGGEEDAAELADGCSLPSSASLNRRMACSDLRIHLRGRYKTSGGEARLCGRAVLFPRTFSSLVPDGSSRSSSVIYSCLSARSNAFEVSQRRGLTRTRDNPCFVLSLRTSRRLPTLQVVYQFVVEPDRAHVSVDVESARGAKRSEHESDRAAVEKKQGAPLVDGVKIQRH